MISARTPIRKQTRSIFSSIRSMAVGVVAVALLAEGCATSAGDGRVGGPRAGSPPNGRVPSGALAELATAARKCQLVELTPFLSVGMLARVHDCRAPGNTSLPYYGPASDLEIVGVWAESGAGGYEYSTAAVVELDASTSRLPRKELERWRVASHVNEIPPLLRVRLLYPPAGRHLKDGSVFLVEVVGSATTAAGVGNAQKRTLSLLASELTVSPDGQHLLVAGPEASVRGNGVRVSFIKNNKVLLLDPHSLASLSTASPSVGGASVLRFSSDGARIIGIEDGSLKSWPSDGTGAAVELVKDVEAIGISRQGDAAVARLKGRPGYHEIDLATGAVKAVYRVEPKGPNARILVFGPAARYIVSLDANKHLILTDLQTANEVVFDGWAAADGMPNAVDIGGTDPVVAVAGDSGQILVWSSKTNKIDAARDIAGKRVNSVAVSPDGSLVAYAGVSAAVSLYRVASNDVVAKMGQHETPVFKVLFSPDGHGLVTAGFDGLRTWRVGGGP